MPYGTAVILCQISTNVALIPREEQPLYSPWIGFIRNETGALRDPSCRGETGKVVRGRLSGWEQKNALEFRPWKDPCPAWLRCSGMKRVRLCVHIYGPQWVTAFHCNGCTATYWHKLEDRSAFTPAGAFPKGQTIQPLKANTQTWYFTINLSVCAFQVFIMLYLMTKHSNKPSLCCEPVSSSGWY